MRVAACARGVSYWYGFIYRLLVCARRVCAPRRRRVWACRVGVDRPMTPRRPLVLVAVVVLGVWQCTATDSPTAPEGTPGRLPTVLPSSVDNANVNDSIASPAPEVNITGLVIASSLARFQRAAAEVRKSDIRSTVWIPAFFLNETNYSLCGGGGNGLRHAMRNAWNLIASTGVGMAVFEEDVAYAVPNTARANVSVSNWIARRCLKQGARCDLAYLGEWNSFFTTHAIYIPPRTARWLLEMTDTCYPWRAQIDQPMHAHCMHRTGRTPWHCLHPPPYRRASSFGYGFFVQDYAVPAFLHGGGAGGRAANRAIARRRRRRRR